MAAQESRRVSFGPHPDERPGGLGLIEVTVLAEGSIVDVIEKSKDVLRAALSMDSNEWRSPVADTGRLPSWFVAACAPEQTPDVEERWLVWWRGLDADARVRAEDERSWTLADWMHWMQPTERQWSWWDARVEGDAMAIVLVEVQGWPSATGALEWLLRAAGASSVRVAHSE